MNLLETRDSFVKAARNVAEKAKTEGRSLTPREMELINEHLGKARDLDARIQAGAESDEVFNAIMAVDGKHEKRAGAPALTIGDHFVKHAASQLVQFKYTPGASISVPEYKAAGDPHYTGGPTGMYGPALVQVDETVTRAYRPPVVVADLLASGTLSGQAITYFVEGAREGNFGTVPEGGHKPQLHYLYSTVTENLTKIAGFIKLSDEMLDDLAFLVSEINTRLMYDLAVFEEQQLLNGDGTAPNLRGLLNRSGIQTEAVADATDGFNALFRSMTKVSTATGLAPDGLVINPADYQTLRLAVDGNGQYLGGGPFTGQYGNNGFSNQPPVWGLRTVVTAAIAQGTALVGAYRQAATVYRRGGVTVSSTNSNVDDFEHNLVTIRAEERLALAVRVPAAFVKVTGFVPPAGP